MRLHVLDMLQRISPRAAYARGVEDMRRLYEAAAAAMQEKLDRAWQAGYEASAAPKVRYAQEDGYRRGYKRGRAENAPVYAEYCSEHACKLVRLPDGVTLTFGLCRHLHEAARGPDASRDTDAIAEVASARRGNPPVKGNGLRRWPDNAAHTNYGAAYKPLRPPARPTVDLRAGGRP